MGKHAKTSTGSKAKTAAKVAKGTGKGVVVTAVVAGKAVRGTARGVAKTANFCLNPRCLHDARTARCGRKCCQ